MSKAGFAATGFPALSWSLSVPLFSRDIKPAVQLKDLPHRLQLGRHMRSVGRLSAILGAALGLSPAECRRLGRAAALHDVGKLYVPAQLMDKCAALTPDEMATMQQHPRLGFVHLASIGPNMFARFAALIALEHHENWDGSGYPKGLVGEEIGLESRIVAVCDVYSALREARPYKAGMDHAAAMTEICDGASPQLLGKFDPRVVAALRTCEAAIDRAFAG